MSMTLISSVTATSNQAALELNSIPAIYTDLLIVASVRLTVADNAYGVRFNNDSGSNYTQRVLYGNGSSAISYTQANITAFNPHVVSNSRTANTFGNSSFYIYNYSGSTTKSIGIDSTAENNATANDMSQIVGTWNSTAAITSIKFYYTGTANDIAAGSTISLYGINRQSAIGKPKAIGGDITFANGHWYHTFTGSGTFTAQNDLVCDALVVAGGGGGGGTHAGGGGAGGMLIKNKIAVPSGGYPVIVGSGGAGATGSAIGAIGTDSLLSSLAVANGGGGGASYAADSNRNATSGGSGGGGGSYQPSPGGTGLGGSGVSGQGNAGGNGNHSYGSGAGGGAGGGAGAAGSNAPGGYNAAPNGGAGLLWLNGTYYAGGGGGGNSENYGPSLGGIGGGGNGANPVSAPTSGTTNTGGGGGGARNTTGGNGGSGIVIIRYPAD